MKPFFFDMMNKDELQDETEKSRENLDFSIVCAKKCRMKFASLEKFLAFLQRKEVEISVQFRYNRKP